MWTVKFSKARSNAEHLYLLVHVPKCLGTTLTHAISQQLQASVHEFDAKRTKSAIQESVVAGAQKNGLSPHDLDVVHGHAVFEGLHSISNRSPRYFTFLREPASRVVSLYNYLRMVCEKKDRPEAEAYRRILYAQGRLVDFAEWLETRSHNQMTRHLAATSKECSQPQRPLPEFGERALPVAKGFLKRMYFVGLVEQSRADLGFLCGKLGIQPPTTRANASPNYFRLDPKSSLHKRILELNSLDVELYDWARQLRSQNAHRSAA